MLPFIFGMPAIGAGFLVGAKDGHGPGMALHQAKEHRNGRGRQRVLVGHWLQGARHRRRESMQPVQFVILDRQPGPIAFPLPLEFLLARLDDGEVVVDDFGRGLQVVHWGTTGHFPPASSNHLSTDFT